MKTTYDKRETWESQLLSAKQIWNRAQSGNAPHFHDCTAKARQLLALLYIFHVAWVASPADLGTVSIVSLPQEYFFSFSFLFSFHYILLPGCAGVLTQSEKIVLLGYLQEYALFTWNKGWCFLSFERKWLAMLTEILVERGGFSVQALLITHPAAVPAMSVRCAARVG